MQQPIAGKDWIEGAIAVVMASDKVAGPTGLRLQYLRMKGAGEWTDAERAEAHRLLEPYRAVLKLHRITWRPAPTAAAVVSGPVKGRTVTAYEWTFLLRCPFNDMDGRTAIAVVSGAKWNGLAYAVKATPEIAEAVAALSVRHGFALDEQAEALLARARSEAEVRNAASRSLSGRIDVDGLAVELRPYQQAGVEYLVRSKKCFLADDMGLGKTMQALAAIQHVGAWPAAVVTLASVKRCWLDETAKCLPGVRVVVWEGKKGDVGPMDGERVLHVINYDIVPDRLDELKAQKIKALVCDEAHFIKNGKARRTAAVRKLASRVPYRFLLTGTPVLNRPAELLAQLQVAGRIDDMGGFWQLAQRYCGAKQVTHGRQATHWDFSGASHLEELNEKLRACCFLRRTKAEVLTELPERIETRVPLELNIEGRRLYDSAAGDLKTWLAEKASCGAEWEASVAHLEPAEREWKRQERIASAVERIDGMEMLLRLQTLGEVAAQAKLAPAVEWIREMCAGRKLLLFGHHRSVMRNGLMKLVGEELGAVLIDGNTTAAARSEAVRRFRSDPACRLMLANLTAAGTGLDGLQHAAHHVAFIEWPWTPGSMEQAVSRLERMGQKSSVNVWHLVAHGTVDAERLAVLSAKASIADAATNGQEGAMAAARVVLGRMNDQAETPKVGSSA